MNTYSGLPTAALNALTEAAKAISSTLELDAVLEIIARLAREVTRGEASSVLTIRPGQGKLLCVAASGGRRDAIIGHEVDASVGIPGRVLRSGEAVCLADVSSHRFFSPEIDDLGSLRTRSLICAPMLSRSDAIGVIEVVNRLDGADFDDTDLKILQVFATLAASAIQNARSYDGLKRTLEGFRERGTQPIRIVGREVGFRTVIDLCDRVAASNATVLLQGESGTGKELCARYIHQVSRRRHEAFAAVNCAALPENLLESELFGHEKGSFTGAHKQRIGWFELADGGTLLLDEIGDISGSIQAKLLRVLQEREFTRVGSSTPLPCNVRIIAATNRDLKQMMVENSFREDLYYRLSVFPIELPPLRERREDIPALVKDVLARASQSLRLDPLQISEDAMHALVHYDWPGNIRELQNVLERAVLLCDGTTLLPHHLPAEIAAPVLDHEGGVDVQGPITGMPTLHGQERSLIVRALQKHDWNQSQTARELGITRDCLRNRIKRYALRRPESPSDVARTESSRD